MLILAIETSCDETAAAVFCSTRGLLSNALFSQISLHAQYGGVVPELASRSHIEKIQPIVQQALEQAHVSLNAIDTIAVTNKPGLPGSLLVGVCFAKTVAFALKKKLIGVNHLEGHMFSACIENNVPFPFVCLTASGGHTSLYLVHDFGQYTLLGQTLDDAAGEAFDKIGKLMKLPYPGGPEIEKLAHEAEYHDFCHYPRGNPKTLDFSFSGLKTAVLYDLVKKQLYNMQTKTYADSFNHKAKIEIASSMLVCVKDIFIQKIAYALQLYPQIKAVTFVGGVACNKYLKKSIHNFCVQKNVSFFTPSAPYCTDNAAMIAFVANYKAQQGLFNDQTLDVLT